MLNYLIFDVLLFVDYAVGVPKGNNLTGMVKFFLCGDLAHACFVKDCHFELNFE